MSIKILLTGGTIDKHYNESNGELDFSETHIHEILKLGRNLSDVTIEQVMLKDSLDIDNTDRGAILEACLNASEEKILITHGTDTMVDTAKVLGAEKLTKTIVLVGAMVPFVFKHSDALFNVGFAMATIQTMPYGVYIAMNGQVFEYDQVLKNKKKGIFETN